MSSSTLVRCGVVWIVFMAFLYDGGKLLRAQDQPTDTKSENGLKSQTPESKVLPVQPADSVDLEAESATGVKSDLSQYAPPSWFKGDLEFDSRNGILFVETDEPAQTVAHAEAELERKSVAAVKNAVTVWMELANPEDLKLTADYVFSNLLVGDRKVIKQDLECKMLAEQMLDDGNLKGSDNDLQFYCGYAQFQLNDDFKAYVVDNLRESKTKKRLVRSGLIGGSIFTLLAIAFGYLKMETATRGFYSRRLQTVSVFVAVISLAIFYWFGQQFV